MISIIREIAFQLIFFHKTTGETHRIIRNDCYNLRIGYHLFYENKKELQRTFLELTFFIYHIVSFSLYTHVSIFSPFFSAKRLMNLRSLSFELSALFQISHEMTPLSCEIEFDEPICKIEVLRIHHLMAVVCTLSVSPFFLWISSVLFAIKAIEVSSLIQAKSIELH